MRLAPAVAALAFAAGLQPLRAQVVEWMRLPWPNGLVVGPITNVVHDEARDVLVVVPEQPTLFEFDGSQWRTLPLLAGNEVFRLGAYDPVRRHAVVLVVDPLTSATRTCAWDGVTLQVLEAASPLPVLSAFAPQSAMARDPATGDILLHAVSTTGTRTFCWNGATWQNRGPAPTAWGVQLCADPQTGVLLMFFWPQVHAWDGSRWVLLPVPVPGVPNGAAVIPGLGLTLVASSTAGNEPAGTWRWSGSAWTEVAVVAGTNPALGALGRGSSWCLAHGAGTAMMLTRSDVWRLAVTPATAPGFASVGQGCAGPTGTPRLLPVCTSLPRLGETFHLQLDNLPPAPVHVPFALAGTGVPVPRDLAAFGMPGCTAYLAPVFSATLANAGGTAAWDLPVPWLTALVGASFHVQGAVLVPGWNAGSLIVSNAGRIVVGTP
jgi:hypothetical protein